MTLLVMITLRGGTEWSWSGVGGGLEPDDRCKTTVYGNYYGLYIAGMPIYGK